MCDVREEQAPEGNEGELDKRESYGLREGIEDRF